MQSDAAGCKSCRVISRTAAGTPGPGRSPVGFRPFPPVERAPPEAQKSAAAERLLLSGKKDPSMHPHKRDRARHISPEILF